jgi:hypothetical protein
MLGICAKPVSIFMQSQGMDHSGFMRSYKKNIEFFFTQVTLMDQYQL